MSQSIETKVDEITEVVVFHVGNIKCGMKINDIQEIKNIPTITKVHGAPDFIRGVVNLRGQIVTIIDIRTQFSLKPVSYKEKLQVIVVRNADELVGLLVDEVEDVVAIKTNDMQPPPTIIGTVEGHLFNAVCKLDHTLISLLDKDVVLKENIIAKNAK